MDSDAILNINITRVYGLPMTFGVELEIAKNFFLIKFKNFENKCQITKNTREIYFSF